LFRHGDDPGLGVTRILDDADAGPPTGEFDIFQIVDPVLGTLSGRRLARTVEHHEVALEPQPIGPLLTPADQRAVEAHQPDLGPRGQPGSHRVEQRLLGLEPDRASSTRQASGKARSPQRSASIST
jgi:hypothetical protein